MEAHLRAGIAIFNAGGYHTAHDAWEDHWLELDSGSDDELFFHGLIQYTAAVYHARNRNWAGATGLAESAGEYLEPLPPTYCSVNVAEIRLYLATLATDPEFVERRQPLALTHEGRVLVPADLGFEATAVAAACIGEKHGNEALIEQAVAFARADIEKEGRENRDPNRGETGSPFVPLVFDYVREPANRGIITERLGQHVERRVAEKSGVEGLFDPRE